MSTEDELNFEGGVAVLWQQIAALRTEKKAIEDKLNEAGLLEFFSGGGDPTTLEENQRQLLTGALDQIVTITNHLHATMETCTNVINNARGLLE